MLVFIYSLCFRKAIQHSITPKYSWTLNSVRIRFLKHSSHYLSGHVLLLLPRLVSFPILTRTLSTGDYGTLSLLMVTLTLTTSFANLGLQHSAVRFYSQFQTRKPAAISTYYSTLFFATLIFAAAVAFIYFTALNLRILPTTIVTDSYLHLFLLLSLLIPIRSLLGLCTQFLRAHQKTKSFLSFSILLRYTSVTFSLFFLLYIIKNLYGFFCGIILSNIIAFIIFKKFFFSGITFSFKTFSKQFLKECLYYSLPLLFVEFGHTILSLGDRYLLQYYLGPVQLGIYAAGYNVTTYVTEAAITPFRIAGAPLYFDIWTTAGEKATKTFLSESLNYLLMFLIPIAFGFTAISEDLISLLASSKYQQAHIIVPWVITGLLIYGTRIVFDAPLYIYKKTHCLLLLMLFSCVSNVTFNIILIPKYGILGAAISTFLANTIHIISIIAVSFKRLSFTIPYKNITVYLSASLLMYWVINIISFTNPVLILISKVFTGFAVYSVIIVCISKSVRMDIIKFTKHFLVKKYHIRQ